MKTNEKHKTAIKEAAVSVEKPQQSATLSAPTKCADILLPEASPVRPEAADNDDGKIPPLELGEDRLTPVTTPIVRIDSPDPAGSTAAADKVGAPTIDADVAIKAIAAAMDIDTRIAHALVDIHAGVDTAEAFARAYGITLPDKENAGESRLAQVGEAKSTDANVPAEGTAVSARLPEQAVSVPTFLCNPRRGFWD